MTIFVLLLVLSFSGALLAARIDDGSHRLGDVLAAGVALGLASFAAFGFVLGWVAGMGAGTALTAAAATLGAGFILGEAPRKVWRRCRPRVSAGSAILLGVTVLLTAALASRA